MMQVNYELVKLFRPLLLLDVCDRILRILADKSDSTWFSSLVLYLLMWKGRVGGARRWALEESKSPLSLQITLSSNLIVIINVSICLKLGVYYVYELDIFVLKKVSFCECCPVSPLLYLDDVLPWFGSWNEICGIVNVPSLPPPSASELSKIIASRMATTN